MATEAETFLASHSWCNQIVSVHLAWAVAGVLGVFKLRLVPAHSDIDNILWVVVGDLPSAYLVTDDAPTWPQALSSYVCELRKWVEAVRNEHSLEDVIPVAAAPTKEHAQLLEGRLNFIEREILAANSAELEGDA